METRQADIHGVIATQVRTRRAQLALSLEGLSARSGVSRSMISLIERGEASPTAVVLERLAWAFGVPLARLFDEPEDATTAPAPVARRAEQVEWRDPGSGYRRRNLSPARWPSPIHLVEIEFPPGAKVSYETTHREPAMAQQVWLLSGRLTIDLGRTRHELHAGDCLAMRLEQPVTFANPGRAKARYVVAVCTERCVGRARP